MASDSPIDPECEVTICLHRILVGVEHQEHLPELPASVAGETAKNGVESNTRAIAHLSESPWHGIRAENVCRDEIKHGSPGCCPQCSRSLHPFVVGNVHSIATACWALSTRHNKLLFLLGGTTEGVRLLGFFSLLLGRETKELPQGVCATRDALLLLSGDLSPVEVPSYSQNE